MSCASRQPALRPADQTWSRLERYLLLGCIAVALALRIVYAWQYRFDTDETQHLHVTWGWTVHLLQYRDQFDNHAPLFHMLTAPILWLIGPTPDAVIYMRLAMNLPYGVILLAAYYTGKALGGRRVGLQAVAALAVLPMFFLRSLEYRADDLWAMLWVLAVMLCAAGRISSLRALPVGFLMGAAVSASVKTTFLLTGLAIAAAGLAVLAWRDGSLPPVRTIVLRGLWLLAGFVIVPLAVCVFFLSAGALGDLYRCIIQHNAGMSMRFWSWKRLLLPVGIVACIVEVRRIVRHSPSAAAGAGAWITFLGTGTALAVVSAVWPFPDESNYLPIYPFACVWVVLLLAHRSARWFPLILAAELLVLLISTPPWRDENAPARALVADVLRLTDPADPIADAKGESIFRYRPMYYVLERATGDKIDRGLLADDIPERLVRSRTCVVVPAKYPPRTRRFVEENYISVGSLLVAGKFLPRPESGVIRFRVEVPATYTIRTPQGQASGQLDGAPLDGPRLLDTGEHEFVPDHPDLPHVLIWSQAIERGFLPVWPKH